MGAVASTGSSGSGTTSSGSGTTSSSGTSSSPISAATEWLRAHEGDEQVPESYTFVSGVGDDDPIDGVDSAVQLTRIVSYVNADLVLDLHIAAHVLNTVRKTESASLVTAKAVRAICASLGAAVNVRPLSGEERHVRSNAHFAWPGRHATDEKGFWMVKSLESHYSQHEHEYRALFPEWFASQLHRFVRGEF